LRAAVCHAAEADTRHFQARAAEANIFHGISPMLEIACASYSNAAVQARAMLTVRTYDDGETFWREVGEPLSVRGVLTNVFVGVAYAIRRVASEDVLRFGVFEGDRLVLGSLRTPPFRLNLADFGDGEIAAHALVQHLADHRVRLPGVTGEERLVEHFAPFWT